MLDFSVTFIITIINITILFFLLRAILFKPVTKFMAERSRRVQDSIDQAEKNRTEAQNLLLEYENRLKNAEAEAQEILRAARENANLEAERIIAEGKEAAQGIILNTRKRLEAEQLSASAKFREEAAVLVMTAASRLTSREFNNDDNRRYANMLLEELAAKKGNN